MLMITFDGHNQNRQKNSSMGNISNSVSQQFGQAQSSSQIKVDIDLKHPIHQELKQLLHWSLEEIRNIYAPFRKRKGSPLLTRSEFLRFLQMSRVSSFHIFDILNRSQTVNTFEIISLLILTAHTSYLYKIQFLFNVFDFSGLKRLKYQELVLMYKSLVRGFALITSQSSPQIEVLEGYAQTVLSLADLNNDQNLQIGEILSWIESNSDATALFKRFEPKMHVKEEYNILSPFVPYKSDEVEIVFDRISRSYDRTKLQECDYQILKPVQRRSQPEKENLLRKSTNIKRSSLNRTGNFANHSRQSSANSRLLIPPISNKIPRTSEAIEQSMKAKPTRFSNIIIIKGRTITKKEVFDLREYFDQISHGKSEILVEDFIDSFSQERYNHMKSVAASLYNFLDHNQTGRVTFKELVLKLYPNLLAHHLPTIERWSHEYNLSFNIKNKAHTKQNQDLKKRVLPKTCLPRFREMFNFFDQSRKGYVVYDDLRRVLCEVCTEKQMTQLFQQSDKDKDGKLTIQELTGVLLPYDLQIEGLQ